MRAYARRHYGIDDFRLRRAAGDRPALHGHRRLPVDLQHLRPQRPGSGARRAAGRLRPLRDRHATATIYQLVPTSIMCRHTVGLNWTSIGIEHVGRSDGQVLGNAASCDASLRLTRHLQGRFRIRTRNVIGHNESLSSPFHRERVESLRRQTHGDFAARRCGATAARSSACRSPAACAEPRASERAKKRPGRRPCSRSGRAARCRARPPGARRVRASSARTLSSRAPPWPPSRPHHRSSATRACAWTSRSRATPSSARCRAPPAAIGSELKIAGFRQGKVPPQVVIQRVGREAVLDEAVRRGAARLVRAGGPGRRHRHGRRPEARPQQTCPRRARRSRSRIEVGVRPPAKLGDWKGVEVGRREPQVAPDEVQAELERLRESLASLETVEREAERRRLPRGRLPRHGGRRGRSRAARRAATCSSSARAAWSRASRSSSAARRPATSARCA